jgi:hypothetical protein
MHQAPIILRLLALAMSLTQSVAVMRIQPRGVLGLELGQHLGTLVFCEK